MGPKCYMKLCDPSLTRAVPERFRDEHRTHYTTLYLLYLLFSAIDARYAARYFWLFVEFSVLK